MDTVADLLLDDAHADRPALRAVGPDRSYDYRRLGTDARKTGNALSLHGVREGRTLVIADDPVPEAVLALAGGALLGATVRFGPSGSYDARAAVAPVDRVTDYDLPAGGVQVGYGGAPDTPAVVHFEEEMWSENPTFPPPTVSPADPFLVGDGKTVTHATTIDAAGDVADRFDDDDRVALRAALTRPEAVVAGVVAPLVAGACVVLPDPATPDRDLGTVAVVDGGSPPEPETVTVGDIGL